jgi:hypothetical protein
MFDNLIPEVDYNKSYLLHLIYRYKEINIICKKFKRAGDVFRKNSIKLEMKECFKNCSASEIEDIIKLLPEIFILINNPTEEQINLYNLLSI